jgi:hypothetical protein
LLNSFPKNDIAKAQEREALRQINLLVGHNQGKSNSEFEFYPYRYFAAEGFLPGFNFPRLPVRAYIPTNDGGEFISRPRVVALREFALSNIIYYEGSKFMVSKTKIPVGGIDSQYQRVKCCFNCGYFHTDNLSRDTCENCGAQFKADTYQNLSELSRILGSIRRWCRSFISATPTNRCFSENRQFCFRYLSFSNT